MQTLSVDLGERSYPIYIGGQLLGQTQLIRSHITDHQVMIITNDTVAPLYLDTVKSSLVGLECQIVVLPDGEQYKNLEVLKQIFDALLQHRFGRQCTLVALGGGVIGDMTGFAAACYQRGVSFIQIPTTLLAQVDASIGGKTGVNHALGKNMIGAFHQPRCVIVDIDTLSSLDSRQLKAGLAEVIKVSLIQDNAFFQWLKGNIQALLACEPKALAYAIENSCYNKAQIVTADERESGIRALLNLGHTFGHAIETGMGYGQWLHGEAVGMGMMLAANLSMQQGWLSKTELTQIETLIAEAGLPTRLPAQMNYQRFMDLMAVDKKVMAGKLRLILLRAIGQAIVTDEFDPLLLKQTIKAYRAKNNKVSECHH